MSLEYEVVEWVEGEENKIPTVMENFFKAVTLYYNGKLLVQKQSSSGSVQIMPQKGFIQDLTLKKDLKGIKAGFIGDNLFQDKDLPRYTRHSRLIIEGEAYHVFAYDPRKLPK